MSDGLLSLLLLGELACCVAAFFRLQPADVRFGEAVCRAWR